MLIIGKLKKKILIFDIEIEFKNVKIIQFCFKLFYCSRVRNFVEVWEFIFI